MPMCRFSAATPMSPFTLFRLARFCLLDYSPPRRHLRAILRQPIAAAAAAAISIAITLMLPLRYAIVSLMPPLPCRRQLTLTFHAAAADASRQSFSTLPRPFISLAADTSRCRHDFDAIIFS